jgi:hypothetical protein
MKALRNDRTSPAPCSPLDSLRAALREHEANKPPFTFDDLKDSLVRHHVIQAGAVEDAELYDGYRTLDALALVWSDLIKACKANNAGERP